MRAVRGSAHMMLMKQSYGLRPGAAEKAGLELFIEVLTPVLADMETDEGFDLRLEAIAGALIQGVFAGIDDVNLLARDALSGQLTELNALQLNVAVEKVVSAISCK